LFWNAFHFLAECICSDHHVVIPNLTARRNF
jgi:hypothetical protein